MSESLTCIDEHQGGCDGLIEYHTNPYSDSFKAWPRCDQHFAAYVERMADIAQRYPVNAPADFDPLYAGERWDDDY